MRPRGIVILWMMTFLILQSVHSVTRNPVAVQSMFDLDQEVTKAHQSVTETESQSRAIEDRIRKIDGAARLLPARAYGKPFDTAALAKSLTLRSLIAKKDPQLASYLGVGSDLAMREEEEREARRLRAQALGLKTEQIRQKNAAAALHRERSFGAGLNPLTGRRLGQ